MENKPGWQTTEFWLTLGTFVVSGLVLTGIISSEGKDTATNVVSHSIESIAMIVLNGGSVIKYIHSRQKVKEATAKASKPRKRRKTIAKKTEIEETNDDANSQ